MSCRKKFPLTQYQEYKFFNLRVDKIDSLISETNDNCEKYFHSVQYNVRIGADILKIEKNGRSKKPNWIDEITVKTETNLINTSVKYYMTLQIPTMHLMFLGKQPIIKFVWRIIVMIETIVF